MINAQYPGQFKINMWMDQGNTGNFEVSIQKGDGEKVTVHSKAMGQKFPRDDWDAAKERLANAIKLINK